MFHEFCFANDDPALLALARVSRRNIEYGQDRKSFLEPAVQLMHRGTAMRREQRRRHVVIYVARGNRMRCRHNGKSVLDTLHVNPLASLHRLFFPRDNPPRGRTFCRPASDFRHAGRARFSRGALCKTRQKHALYTSRRVLREHLRGGQEVCVAANQHLRSTLLAANTERCFERARQRFHEERIRWHRSDAHCSLRERSGDDRPDCSDERPCERSVHLCSGRNGE